ncbi:hypothetical protein [Siccirubricoccus phaeus]|uniref:hypothetical protein n=1 Tax=Siccirubricoccus phaeus TaxID=2595053 RepID=UPI00165BB3A9|nr:hypothetical protein [Siccirubricoccus phaeus]
MTAPAHDQALLKAWAAAARLPLPPTLDLFDGWAARGFGPALLPLPPFGAPFAQDVPLFDAGDGFPVATRRADGFWAPLHDWENRAPATPDDFEVWGAMGAWVGVRAGTYPAVAISALDHKVRADLINLATWILGGMRPVREEHGGRLLLIRRSTPQGVVHPEHIEWQMDGLPCSISLLGEGQAYCVGWRHQPEQRRAELRLLMAPPANGAPA